VVRVVRGGDESPDWAMAAAAGEASAARVGWGDLQIGKRRRRFRRRGFLDRVR
jgi:hypothetical protein